MDKFTTEIIQTLAQNGNIGEVFRSHLEKAVNTLLAQELTAFLDYEKYDRIGFNFGNSRNGIYERAIFNGCTFFTRCNRRPSFHVRLRVIYIVEMR